jgi:hypothetical protein
VGAAGAGAACGCPAAGAAGAGAGEAGSAVVTLPDVAPSPAARGATGSSATGPGDGALGVPAGRPGAGSLRPSWATLGGAVATWPSALRAWDCFGPCVANASLSLRTTGASIVEDADRTNSPISWSLAITALLSTPNSFASSYTRTFATALPLLGPGSPDHRAGPGAKLRPASDSAVHRRVLIGRSSQSDPAFPAVTPFSSRPRLVTPDDPGRHYSHNRARYRPSTAVTAGPFSRSARLNPRRRCACSKQLWFGCT